MTTANPVIPPVTPVTLAELASDVLTRLGDTAEEVWTTDEAIKNLIEAEHLLTRKPVFYDWAFLENLPRGMSYTQPWEHTYGYVAFDWGVANYTLDDERRLLGDERLRVGPGNHTTPCEATDGWLASAGANTAIPATADVPKTLTRLTRVTWDKRGLDAMSPHLMQSVDSRYQITAGEVYGFMWQVDGVRTLRKVRVPAAQADTATVTGSWGIARDVTDLSTDTPITRGPAGFGPGFGPGFFTDDADGAVWGVPRRIPGQHPLGPERFGTVRRPFLDGTNVRVEHMRQGRAMDRPSSVCELPRRYARYLRDYAQAQLLGRTGPGQDLKLAEHFRQRWERGLARIDARIDRVDRTRVSILGGDGRSALTSRPPRPSRPWPYGSVVR